MWSAGQNTQFPSATGAAAGGWRSGEGQNPSTDRGAGYHQRQQVADGGWGAPQWPDEASTGQRSEGRLVWNTAEDEKLWTSVRENGLDDWTLGDWSEVAAAVGGGKTAEQCFNRWHTEYSRQVTLGHPRRQGGYYDSSEGRGGSNGASYAGQQQQQYWPQHLQGAGTAAASTSGNYYPNHCGEAAEGRTGSGAPETSTGRRIFRLNQPSGGGYDADVSAGYGNGGWHHPVGGNRPGWNGGQVQADSAANEDDGKEH